MPGIPPISVRTWVLPDDPEVAAPVAAAAALVVCEPAFLLPPRLGSTAAALTQAAPSRKTKNFIVVMDEGLRKHKGKFINAIRVFS